MTGFSPHEKESRIKRTYTLTPEAIKTVNDLAEKFNSTNSAVVEELICKFGLPLLEDRA